MSRIDWRRWPRPRASQRRCTRSRRRNRKPPPVWTSESLRWRRERLSLLHHVGDENPGFGLAGLAACMRRFGRYLESIAGLDYARRLALHRQLEATFQDIRGLDSGMRVSPDRDTGLDRRLDEQRLVAGRGPVRLRQDLSRDATRCCRRRTL